MIVEYSSKFLNLHRFQCKPLRIFQCKPFPWFSELLQIWLTSGFRKFYVLWQIKNIFPILSRYQHYWSDCYFKSYSYFKSSTLGLFLDHFPRLYCKIIYFLLSLLGRFILSPSDHIRSELSWTFPRTKRVNFTEQFSIPFRFIFCSISYFPLISVSHRVSQISQRLFSR